MACTRVTFFALLFVTVTTPTRSQVRPEGDRPRVRNQEADSHFSRGNEHLRKKEYDNAIDEYTKALRIVPDDVYYLNRGLAFFHKSQHARALEDYNSGIALNPGVPGLFLNRANVYYRQQNFERAIADYTEAIRIDPKFDAAPYTARAYLYFRQQKYDLAIEDYTDALSVTPNNARIYSNRGAMYLGKETFQRAIADFTQAISMDPTLAEVYYNRGLAYGYLNKRATDETVRDMARATQLKPELGRRTSMVVLVFEAP